MLLLSTMAGASQAIYMNKKVLPTVVVPGMYNYAEKAELSGDAKEDEVIRDSSGTVIRSTAGLMRRDPLPASLLATEDVETKRDLYVKVGDSLCDGGGGLWKRYEVNSVIPGSYGYCAPFCDAKEECIGFDVGLTGCNLYTQKAVALGTWPNVHFNGADPFDGENSHNDYPASPLDLTAGDTDFGKDKKFKCYRKTYYRPVQSFYRKIGFGPCDGGGEWKRYKKNEKKSEVECEHTCNIRDECVGFDTHSGECHLYTQKAMYGLWPGVDTTPLAGAGDRADKFPPTPYDLTVTDGASSDTACWGKTHWVNLASYYTTLGQQTCEGGGLWKHYKADAGTTLDECKGLCDEKTECVGLDFTGTSDECRLFTSGEPGAWTGVSGTLQDGTGHHATHFAPTAFSLSAKEDAAVDGSFCLAKTHTQPPANAQTVLVTGR